MLFLGNVREFQLSFGVENLRLNIEATLGKRLADDELQRFVSLLTSEKVRRKTTIVSAGKLCRKLYFVRSGLLHSYLTKDNGDNQTIQLALERNWISDLSGFISKGPALFNVEALEDTEVFVLDVQAFDQACNELPDFERFFRILIQNAYVATQQRLAATYSDEAEKRYLHLLENQPDLIRRVPQYLIASYLGVKPQSLSRIRKSLAHPK